MAVREFDEAVAYSIGLRTRFRGIDVREGMLLRSGEQWAEWSPFTEYDDAEAATWLRASLAEDDPVPLRTRVPVNVTVPVVTPDVARRLVEDSRCRTAKVKVADPRSSLEDDLHRLEAVRRALGPDGALRVDANGAWSVGEALVALRAMERFGLQYAEQPCRTVEELAELRRRLRAEHVAVPVAADESIRRSGDPMRVAELGAADVVVLKVQPLGGWRACLELVAALGLPAVISSALETSLGIWAGLRTAAALPSSSGPGGSVPACGLDTVRLFTGDAIAEPLISQDGEISVGERPVPDTAALARVRADADRQRWWRERLERCLRILDVPRRDASGGTR
ncbi:o-succinylbenzoate synthase [Brooklawnia cerclae]|uniref:o-succinylbenzoate synthase n=1 Tax=Brooklawnia cerclae TaxID=349934 RepID=A0ABX0SBJ5_9ACTN|nr:o-succinylbenzoate synthase [Brooklawnia cerclae]NIH55760.1 O-succinylbenzoate synthase [Brooklawnia cerclae]